MYYAEGYDFEVSYVRDVGPGTMSLRLMATNYLEDATDNGTEVIDRAGENIEEHQTGYIVEQPDMIGMTGR